MDILGEIQMAMDMLIERTREWRATIKPLRPWQGLLALALLLLMVDLIGLTRFISDVAVAIDSQSQHGLQNLLFAVSITLTITAGQIGFWALFTGRVESFTHRRIFVAFNLLGGLLNVVGIFLPLVAGTPTADNFMAAIENVANNALNLVFIAIYAMLAIIVSLVPEYLLVSSVNLKEAQEDVEPETAQAHA
jgi:hypothetical protein